ncbi:MAG: YciI family protein [Bacteroidota bacterium]
MISKIVLTIAVLFCFVSALRAQDAAESESARPRTFEMKEGDTTYTMKQYVFVVLMRGKKAYDYSEAELDSLQAGHMANMNRLAEEGKLVMAGPFGEGGDHRGLMILDCATIEEAEAFLATDPAVQAGRLRCEFHTWWGAVGTELK